MSEYSADTVIDQYAADISAWEQRLCEFEEQAKGLSLDKPADQKELYQLANDMIPDITDHYDEVQASRSDVKHLEEQIDVVLDNPDLRFASLPQSLDRHEEMKEQINDLDETYHCIKEQQEYISMTLNDEVGLSIEDYSATTIQQYIDTTIQKIQDDPDTAFAAGLLVGGAGAIAINYLRNRNNSDKQNA